MDQESNNHNARLHVLEQKVEQLEIHVSNLRRAQMWSRIFKFIYVMFFVALSLVMFYYLRPMYETVFNVYNSSGLEINPDNFDFEQMRSMMELLH